VIDDVRLTWHVGSLLPYASLPHTIQRVCALNCLRRGELPALDRRSVGAPSVLTAGGIDLARLARWIGEPEQAFRWATLDAIPHWLRGHLILPYARVCEPCLACGYHAALFSVKLLDACPMHGTPLVASCRCGQLLPTTLGPAVHDRAGSCACGQLRFFTRETCRRPLLDASLTHALDAAVAWLEALGRLVRAADVNNDIDAAQLDRNSLGVHIPVWCTALGLPYPSCFRAPPRPVPVVVAKRPMPCGIPSRILLGHAPPHDSVSRLPFWSDTPAHCVYRAMARHVRRHIAPDSTRWLRRFVTAGGPLQAGHLLREAPRAVLAFAVLLWTHDVEPNVQQHRWPDRPPPAGSAGGLSKRVMAAASVQPPAFGTVDFAGQQWLAYHAAGTAMQVAWRDAEAMATLAAHIGIVGCVRGAQSPPQAGHWWAAARPHGTLCFAARDHGGKMWQAAPRQDKRARCLALAASQAARHRKVLAACEGPCLTYSMLTGWEAKHGVPPVDAAMRRLRLLGLDGKRPHFWLYHGADGRFVARLCQSRLQALGAAPTTAIAALRTAALDYVRRYGSLP